MIEVLTGSDNPRRYWSDLKRKLKAEGSQLYENIVQLKMESADGKKYSTDVANTKEIIPESVTINVSYGMDSKFKKIIALIQHKPPDVSMFTPERGNKLNPVGFARAMRFSAF